MLEKYQTGTKTFFREKFVRALTIRPLREPGSGGPWSGPGGPGPVGLDPPAEVSPGGGGPKTPFHASF